VTLKILDLFSGISGFTYAFDNVEVKGKKVFETVAFVEIDKECHKVLKKHWPNTPILEDVKNLNYIGNSLCEKGYDWVTGDIDIIVGGFPCTDISTAGKQKGLIDEGLVERLVSEGLPRELAEEKGQTRSGLWTEYKRLIEEIRPSWVVIENVANLRSNGLATVLLDLNSLGYDAEWEVISARDVGACHLRERIWIVAYPDINAVRDISKRGEKTGRRIRTEGKAKLGNDGENEHTPSSYPDHFRCWPSFASEEEKSKWWTTATAEFRDWIEAQPTVCGAYDGLPPRVYGGTSDTHPFQKRLEEKARQARIRQLGNSIVPFIAKIIATRIAYHELSREAVL